MSGPPLLPLPSTAAVPAHEARFRLRVAVDRFFDLAGGFDPEDPDRAGAAPIAHAIRADIGLGKSDRVRRRVAAFLAGLRARRDPRAVAVAVPTHRLADEQVARFMELPEARAAGLTAAVWRGCEADDPETPSERMCHDLEAVRDALAVGADVERSVCRRRSPDGGGEAVCAFHAACGAQRQKLRGADVWFVPHELLFTRKPPALGALAAVVVDEAPWADGLEGVGRRPDELTLDTLDEEVTVPGDPGGDATEQLRFLHRLVRRALAAQPDGPLRRSAMLAAGPTEETGRDGRRLSWRRVAEPGIVPGMAAAERRTAVGAAAGNRDTMRLARFFGALEALLGDGGPQASGWISLATAKAENGRVRVLRLRGRRAVAEGWRVPTLLIDALLDPALVRPYWPNLEVAAEIAARTPHMRVRQLVGRDWAKTAPVPDEFCDAAETERRLKNSGRLRAAVLREVRATAGRVLVVCQMAVEAHWRRPGPLPDNMEMAHHNAVAGRDEWGPGPGRHGVRKIVVVGRTLPRPGDVERMAEALTGRAVAARLPGRYERHAASILLEDGTAVAAEADRHPDPVAEAIRWQICEGEIIQIVGRGRGVNRTAADPLEVLMLTDRPLPLPVAETVAWEALEPAPVDLMLAEGGVALLDAADAARAYPALWPNRAGTAGSPEAARKAFQRARCGTSPMENSLMGNVPHLWPAWPTSAPAPAAGPRPPSSTRGW